MTKTQDRRDSPKEQTVINTPAGSEVDQIAEELDRRVVRLRELNDRLRTTGRGGMVVMTNGVAALSVEKVKAIFAEVVAFTDFNPSNDPWGEHDCAAMTVSGIRLIWKIDYYDRSRRIHSPDATDPKVTVRVLTVMLASEY
jgi:Protein of unknown function (DUF3768)